MRKTLSTGLAILGVSILIFGGLLLTSGIAMHERWPLRRADAALLQVRDSFILMQPYLDILLHAFPDRTPNILAAAEHDGVQHPLRITYKERVPNTLIENHYSYDYEDWHTLDWFLRDAMDAAVFLTSSPYLPHTLSNIWIEPFGLGSSTLIANVNLGMDYTVTMVIFRDSPDGRPADARVHHREELGGGYHLRVQVYMLRPTLGRFVAGVGVVVIIIGAVPAGFFMRNNKSRSKKV